MNVLRERMATQLALRQLIGSVPIIALVCLAQVVNSVQESRSDRKVAPRVGTRLRTQRAVKFVLQGSIAHKKILL